MPGTIRDDSAGGAPPLALQQHTTNGLRRLFDRIGVGRLLASPYSRESATLLPLALGLFVTTTALVWLGYVATREWKRGTDLLRDRLAAEVLALGDVALARDMKGAWTSLIVPLNPLAIREDPPYDMLQQTAQSFARFPYPESVIVWKDAADAKTYAFNRADRRPAWDTSAPSNDPFPVVIVRDPPALAPLIQTAREYGSDGRPFTVFDINIGPARYQVVAHLMFSAASPERLTGLAAFTVNLDWVRQEYFGPLLSQVARIGGSEGGVQLAVFDETRQLVAASDGMPHGYSDTHRSFPLVFLEPAVITSLRPHHLRVRTWTLHADLSPDDTADGTLDAASRVFALVAVAAVASTIALFQTVRTVRASARLATMKSEFVAAVTHELKTPLALIRLVADTLAKKRYSSAEVIEEYAGLLSQETARLSQSIDQLLTYARYTSSVAQPARDAALHAVADLVEDALEHFRPTLASLGFQVTLDLPRTLPLVSVDGRAIVQALETVMDNAIKYSSDSRTLSVTAYASGKHVTITIADTGVGIPVEDVPHVFDRFFRGRNAKGNGSGLGLAIAHRILRHNKGDLVLRSTLGVGTEVDCILPVAG